MKKLSLFAKNFLMYVVKTSAALVTSLFLLIVILKLLFSPLIKIDNCRVQILGGMIDINDCQQD